MAHQRRSKGRRPRGDGTPGPRSSSASGKAVSFSPCSPPSPSPLSPLPLPCEPLPPEPSELLRVVLSLVVACACTWCNCVLKVRDVLSLVVACACTWRNGVLKVLRHAPWFDIFIYFLLCGFCLEANVSPGNADTAPWEGGPPPPWKLYSPSGFVFHVRDSVHLTQLAAEVGVAAARMKELVGLKPPQKGKLPQYRVQWQLLQHVKVIQRVDDLSRLVPIVGDATHFVQSFAKTQQDTEHFEPTRLASFLNGNLKSTGKKTLIYAKKGVVHKWQLASGSPVELRMWVPSTPNSSFAAPAQVTSPTPSQNPVSWMFEDSDSLLICVAGFFKLERRTAPRRE
jgi:hypothetical protein